MDLENPRCVKNKIKELCNMSIEDIQIKYSKTFEKSKLNQKLINKFINKKGIEWNLSNEYNHQNYLY